jgi:hypothetical protein
MLQMCHSPSQMESGKCMQVTTGYLSLLLSSDQNPEAPENPMVIKTVKLCLTHHFPYILTLDLF